MILLSFICSFLSVHFKAFFSSYFIENLIWTQKNIGHILKVFWAKIQRKKNECVKALCEHLNTKNYVKHHRNSDINETLLKCCGNERFSATHHFSVQGNKTENPRWKVFFASQPFWPWSNSNIISTVIMCHTHFSNKRWWQQMLTSSIS